MSRTADGIAAPERRHQTRAIAKDVTGNGRPGQLHQSGSFGKNVTAMTQALWLEVFNQDRLGIDEDVTGKAANYSEISLQLICKVPSKLEAV